ncbi:hypothetical protein [Nitrobacter vulgaris]|uniref:Uncharacterized protein n=1 Tax=Nitrobacter vulgaris TaxID=29421 RepID=A0A1V4I0V2_NITVU|nr:hypothetical protein [Nitrobacter vulgaris]OPH83878.1 hypothetical protein B2M20_04725 [Nitrobacter vulgaris]
MIVTIIESADNENVLVTPVIEAVHHMMTRQRAWTETGSEWLEAFDHLPPLMTILEVMRELDLFLETSLGKYLGMILENKLRKHFEPEPIRSRGSSESLRSKSGSPRDCSSSSTRESTRRLA